MSRRLNVKITQLDNMLEFKSYFQNNAAVVAARRVFS